MKLAKAIGMAGILVLGAPAWAQYEGWYGGAGFGVSNGVLDYDRTRQALADQGFTATIDDDTEDTTWRLFAGYRFNPHFAVEGGYYDLGDFNYRASTTPAGALEGRVQARGLNLDLVGFLPLSQRLSALARIGAHYARVEDDFVGRGGVVVNNMHSRDHSWNAKAGLGLQYDITDRLSARAEWDHYRVRDEAHGRWGVNTYTANLLWSFGRAPQAVPVAATTPVEPAPATPAPVQDTGPSLKSASYSEESLFAFDSAELKPEGRRDLDQLATDVRNMPYERITISGHASRTGSDDYNMQLSARRAQAVRDYLVNTGGLDGTRMVVQPKGETEPITRPEECPGSDERNDPQLQKCLQPDRRVRVDVTGPKTGI